MGTIAGRQAELDEIRDLLASSAKTQAARALRIVGPSGVGKTALLDTALADVPAQWLIGRITSHHIQSSLPYLAARRLIRSLLDELGDGASRYSSGLNLEREQHADYEEAFFRALEGISLDRPLLMAFDDAQWADRESRALIERSVRVLADRPMVLLSCERSEDTGAPAFDFRDEAMVLNELDNKAAATIILDIYPDASADVVEAIVDRAAGRAVDIVTLSEGAREQRAGNVRDVDISLRRTISRDLALVDGDLRSFLQTCSLIADPIELPLLRVLWPEDQLLQLTARATGRFVQQRPDRLTFVHDAIKQSVRETIAIAIPMHRRIIAAIKALPVMRLEDYEHIVDQAVACGDRDLQRATLLALGEEAMKRAILSLAANAWERAIEIAPPAGAEIIPFYSRLTLVYNMLSREAENVRACRTALDAARSAGQTVGVSQLVASMVIAQWLAGRGAAARADLESFRATATDPKDVAQLHSVAAFLAVCTGDAQSATEALEAFEQVQSHADPLVVARTFTTRAYLESRAGCPTETLAAIRAAEEATANLPPLARTMPLTASLLHTFMYGGAREVEPHLGRRVDEHAIEVLDTLRMVTHIARGDFADALAIGNEAAVRQRGVFARRLNLGLRLSAAAYAPEAAPSAPWEESLGEIAAFQTGDESGPLVPIAIAWAHRESAANAKRARLLLTRILERLESGLDPMVFVYPTLVATAAKAAADQDTLERLYVRDVVTTREPWVQAQNRLARGVAGHYLGKSDAREILADARERLLLLGAPFFARIPDTLVNEAAVVKDENRFGQTTRREREIASLVADGLTNREIAEKLVLSERTIEGHVANLFNKLGASSRTQVAAWYLRVTSSAASPQ